MIKEALAYIVGLGNKEVKSINGQSWATGTMNLLAAPTALAIDTTTLVSLYDYLKSVLDIPTTVPVIVTIDSPTKVTIRTRLNQDMSRSSLIYAEAELPKLRLNTFVNIEEFNIMLQAAFVQTEATKELLKIINNIQDSEITTSTDDGISQETVVKSGIATVEKKVLPNPVYLQPYRTFIEVTQPESAFVFRLRKGVDGPVAALFEADGGAWRIEAIANINEFLRGTLNDQLSSGAVAAILS